MGTLQLSPNDPPDQNMVNTGGSVAKNGTFVTSAVSIRNNANHADKTQNVYWTTVIEQGSSVMARNHYIDEILQPVVVPYIQTMAPGALLKDDNARPHRARIVDAYLQRQHITRIDWPVCSPNLNSIEHVWDQLGRALTVLVLISEGFQWRSGTGCHRTMCSVWYTACPEMCSLHCCTWCSLHCCTWWP